MKLVKIDSKSKESNGKVYNADKYTAGNYDVEVYVTKYADGKATRMIYVEADCKQRYLPKIYFSEDFYGESKPRFEIQTTAYGALNVDEIQNVIAGYQEAIEVVKVLTEAFC